LPGRFTGTVMPLLGTGGAFVEVVTVVVGRRRDRS